MGDAYFYQTPCNIDAGESGDSVIGRILWNIDADFEQKLVNIDAEGSGDAVI